MVSYVLRGIVDVPIETSKIIKRMNCNIEVEKSRQLGTSTKRTYISRVSNCFPKSGHAVTRIELNI